MRDLSIVLLIALTACAAAYPKDKPGKGQGHGAARSHSAEHRGFVEHDRVVIVDYCRRSPGGLPPGLAKREDDLPPGLEKQLRRNGRLPPGLEKRLVRFPRELEGRLPPVPYGTERAFIGRFALILNPRTRVIVDVMSLW